MQPRALSFSALLLAFFVAGCGDLKKDPKYVSVGSTSAPATGPATNLPFGPPAQPVNPTLPGFGAPVGSGSLTPPSSGSVGSPSTATTPGGGLLTPPPAPVPQAGPGGLSGPPTRTFPAASDPIVIGQGPVVGTTVRGDVYQHCREWVAGDVRALDPLDVRFAGDGLTQSRELLAFYSRRESGRLNLRVDLFDLAFGAELGGLDLVVLIGWSGRGATALPLGLRETTAHPYDAAIVCRDTQDLSLLDRAGVAAVTTTTGGLEVSFRSDLDTVELGVDEAHLTNLGWTGGPLTFQVLSVQDNLGRVADAVLEVDLNDRRLDEAVLESWVADRRAILSPIAIGNRAALDATYLRGLVHSDDIKTREGFPTGLRRTLASHRAHGLSINLHLSGVLANAIGWASSPSNPAEDGALFLAELATFFDGDRSNGEGDFLPGLYVDNMMPYFRGQANARFIDLAWEVYRDRLGLQAPGKVFWTPERVIGGGDFADIKAAGFTHTVIDRTHLDSWFNVQTTDGALHRINGVDCFVIDPEVNLFGGQDGGPSEALRELLIRRALDANAQQAILTVADWEEYAGRKGNTDVPDTYDRILRWISQRPWIEVAGLQDLAGRGWQPVMDHGAHPTLKTETYEWLRHATEENYDHWYYGHPLEQSLAALQPPIRQGRPMSRRLGDVKSPGTLYGDTWSAIATAPAGGLKHLAETSFASVMYRTAWHLEDMHDTRRYTNGAYIQPDTTYDQLTGFAYALQVRAGEAAVVARAARWAQSPPSQPTAWTEDVDLDGEVEYLLADSKLLVVCERDGGRLTASFVRDPATGEGYMVTGDPMAFPSRGLEAGFEDEGHDAARNSVLKDTWARGLGYGYVNDEGTAAVSTTTVGLVFTSTDGMRTKTITPGATPGTFEVDYVVDPRVDRLYVRCGLNPHLAALALDGQRDLVETDQGGVYTLAKTYQGKTVSVSLGYGDGAHDTAVNYQAGQGVAASPRHTAFQHMLELKGDAPGFSFSLSADVK
ncbi:MAG TPA: hypothetical protein DEA08_33035 [Planctomycetes bacterium]|nr:hypothetical protein [Planctomycetota bacterium]